MGVKEDYTTNAVIRTLDPNKFVEKKQHCLLMRDTIVCKTHVEVHNQSTNVMQRFAYERVGPLGTWQPFPLDTRAFLYYTTPPERPRIGGELRLRVTSSDDPASFASGSDLLRSNGQLWSRPLYTISRSHIPVYQKLREERLVSNDLDTILSTFPDKYFAYSLDRYLYTLNDTFIIDFASEGRYLSVITEQGMGLLSFRRQFYDGRESRRGTPYTGSALVRFERSTFSEHAGTRTIVLRFLRIITPVKCVMPLYDGYIGYPREGELYYRHSYPVKSKLQAWHLNIDKSRGVMLPIFRLLWDA